MDAYTTALTLLSRRELSTQQLRQRLLRRKFGAQDVESVIKRLSDDGTLDDRRVALACARTDAAVRRHGRRRVLQHVQQLGISGEIAKDAIEQVFGDVDEAALLDAAIDKRLRGTSLRTLDHAAKAKLVRHLVSRGFEPAHVFARLRRKGADIDE